MFPTEQAGAMITVESDDKEFDEIPAYSAS